MRLSRVSRFINAALVIMLWMLGGSGIAISAERPMAAARIAVAANFRDTAEAIARHLEARSDYRYDIIVGSTGKLASQIINGAPFDVLMAADRIRPQRLVDEGYAVAGSQRTYALGQLGLWWRFIVFWPSLCWRHCFGPPGGWGRLPITFLPRPSDG